LRIAPELLEPSFSWHRYALWSEDYVFKNKLLGRTLRQLDSILNNSQRSAAVKMAARWPDIPR
jgi:hypothetical protein